MEFDCLDENTVCITFLIYQGKEMLAPWPQARETPRSPVCLHLCKPRDLSLHLYPWEPGAMQSTLCACFKLSLARASFER